MPAEEAEDEAVESRPVEVVEIPDDFSTSEQVLHAQDETRAEGEPYETEE